MHRKPVHCILRTIRRYLGTAMPVYAGYAAFFLLIAVIIAMLLFQVLGQTIVRVLLAISSGSVAGQIAHFTAAVIHRFRPFVLLLSFGTVLLIYTFTPGRPRKIREELPGAVLTAGVWFVLSRIFSFYIMHFWLKSHFYGSLTALVLVMLWLYAVISVLFIGAALNYALRQDILPLTPDSRES